MKYISLISCVLCALCSVMTAHAAVDAQSVTRIYDSLQVETSSSLLGMYDRIREDAVSFPYDLAAHEFKEAYGISSPIFPGGLEDENTLSSYTPIGQLNAYRAYERSYEKMLKDAQFFTDVYLYSKYKFVFANDDLSDSMFDLMSTTRDIVELIDPNVVAERNRYPSFAGGLSTVSRTLLGDRYASVIDDEDERAQKIQDLRNNGGYIFGADIIQDQCVLPGEGVVAEIGTDRLSEEEKDAILGRIADMEEGNSLAKQSRSLDDLLPYEYEKPDWLRVLEGEQLRGARECLDQVCFSVTPIYKQPRLAPSNNTRSITTTVHELKDVLDNAKDRDLSAQCEVKKTFGTPWYNKIVRPVFSPPIITFVPMFVELEYSKVIRADVLFNAIVEWDAIASSPIKDVSLLDVQSSQSLLGAQSVTAITDIETRKEIYKNSLSFFADLQNQYEQTNIVTGELNRLKSELEVFLQTVQSIKKTTETMKSIPNI